MPDISSICHMLSLLPLDCLKLSFMQQALLAVLLLTPMTAALGVEVISFRMAFFSDAIGHSAFAGVALGLLLSVDPHWSMPAFGVLVGLAVMAVRRGSALSSDTVIGIVFSAVVAFGLAVVSRQPGMARTMQQFLYGDVLTVSQGEIVCLAVLFVALLIFQIIGYNRLLYIALNPVMARVHGINVCLWQYVFSGLLALVVMFCVWPVGVLLVTAMALTLGILLGIVVAVIRTAHDQQRTGHKNPILGLFNGICKVYVTVIRGTPMMVQLLIMGFVIFSFSRNYTMVGALTLGINSGAYVSEIIRGGLMSLDPGQAEAGRSLGLGYIDTMRLIVIPQAFKAILPALGNEFIMLLKDTSLITVIGGKEMVYAAQAIYGRTYEQMFPLIGIACIYLVLVMVFSWLQSLLERRLRQSDRR